MRPTRLALTSFALFFLTLPAHAENMTLDRMGALIDRVGQDVEREGGLWRLTIEDVPVMIVTDASVDRMRIMTPIRNAGGLDEA